MAIRNAIEKEESLLLEEFCKEKEEEYALSGSTAAVCLVDLTNGMLVVGNLGDSHILLGKNEDESGTVTDGRMNVVSTKF